jgi:hypothetical protein
MHVALGPGGYPASMSELTNEPLSLDDEQIESAAPLVRALTLQRLELIWTEAERSLKGEADPRWAEIGLRVLKEEARLYRLDRTAASKEDEEDLYTQGVDRKRLVLEQLEMLASSLREDSTVDG